MNSFKLFIVLLSTLTFSNTFCAVNTDFTKKSATTGSYNDEGYNFEVIGKFGLKNKRNIGQAGLLLPLFSMHDNLLYIPVFGMLDNQNSREINIGIGFRKLFNNNFIHGGYAFFDYRRSPRKNFFKQITIGYEFLTKYFEARANVYIPENKSSNLYIPIKDKVETNYGSISNVTTFDIDRTNDLYTEKASKGFDVELGLTKGSTAGIYLAYFRFLNQQNNTNGLRTRGNLRVLPWLTLEAEVSYDNTRKLTPYFGAKINIPFTKSHKKSIYTKMTYLPIRDVDIQTTVKFTPNVHTYHNKTVNGWAPMIDKNGNLGGNVYTNMASLTTQLTAGKKYTDIGTILESQLFTLIGEFTGEYVLVKQGTNEYDILTNIKTSIQGHKIVLDHATTGSPLNYTYQKGFWTDRTEFEETIAIIKELKSKFKNLEFTEDDVKHVIKKGTGDITLQYALKWEFRNRSDVFIANFKGCTDDTSKNNTAELTKALNGIKGERFVLINLYRKDHHIGVVIDKTNKDIIFAESNNLPINTLTEEALLNTQFPASTYTTRQYTFVKQAEEWSCGPHAFMNMVGLVKGHFAYNSPFSLKSRRHVGAVFERMFYQKYAYIDSLYN